MTVITLSACPQRLKGDITRWMFEIDTGVYVGNPSARVRDALWKRICENIGSGRASMAYSTNNEQKFDVRICGYMWEPSDYDGVNLVKRKFKDTSDSDYKKSSKAAVNHMIKAEQRNKVSDEVGDYVVLDIETTGIGDNAEVIEVAALKVRDGLVTDKYSTLVNCNKDIPEGIVRLTGITKEMLSDNGETPAKAAEMLADFCGKDVIVGHNIMFDLRFLQKIFKQNNIPTIKNKTIDTMRLARKTVKESDGYGLESLCKHYGIETAELHRALNDCYLTYRIFKKLKEK